MVSDNWPAEIKVDDERRSAYVQLVSDNYFDLLGVHALRGRVFHQSASATSGGADGRDQRGVLAASAR